MVAHNIYDLADCSEFRQTIAAKSPAVVHGAVLLLILLLVAAATWSGLVEADLVVQAPGRVRPIEQPARVFTAVGEQLDGRVAEVHFQEGECVRQGQLLVRLDTQRLDNEIARLQRTIDTCREELIEIKNLDALTAKQFESARAKAEAEWNDAQQELQRAQAGRASRIRQAEAAVEQAFDKYERLRRLSQRSPGAVSQSNLVAAQNELLQDRESLAQAKLPVDDGDEIVFRRAMQLVDDEFAVRRAELVEKRVIKSGEIEASEKQLANLQLQKQQAELRSPFDGVVVAGRIKTGDVLEAGKPVVEIARQDGFVFEAVVPSADVGEIRTGMPVKIKFDAYDHQQFGTLPGTVSFISPDSQPAGDNDQAGGDLAYLVRVKLARSSVGRHARRGRVKLGLGGTAEIVTDRQSILTILSRNIRGTVSLN